MGSYTLQSYFKVLSESWFIAYDAMNRKRDELKKSKLKRLRDVREVNFWKEKYEHSNMAICNALDKAAESNVKFIITSSEEVMALIDFFTVKEIDSYPIVDTSDYALKSFPDDPMSQDFLAVYRGLSEYTMIDLKTKYL